MNRQISYTPFAMLAFLASEFVTGNALPAIKNGRPVYELTKDERVEGGCFAYTVSTLHPKIINRLREVGTHANANVRDLVAEGTEILNTLDAPYWGSDMQTDFLQALQDVHDSAARLYWRNIVNEDGDRLNNVAVETAALALFRQHFNAGLEAVRTRFNVEDPSKALVGAGSSNSNSRRYGC